MVVAIPSSEGEIWGSELPNFYTDTSASRERQKIIQALNQHDGNRTETARVLGMDRTTLWRKMKRYNIR